MEVDAVKWITDVEVAGEKNARNLSRLNVQMDQVKADLSDHRADSKERSDHRLEQIMAGFDRLDKAEEKKEAKILAAKRLWIPLIVSAILGMGGLIKLAYIDPLDHRIDVIERRLYEADVNSIGVSGES